METPGDRVRHLLTLRWNGNQTEMSKETKCAQATLSLIANSIKEPGKRVLNLIGSTPGVNRKWLFEGVGKPLVKDVKQTLATDCYLPVAKRAIPGNPSEHLDAMKGEKSEVMPTHATPYNYWLELSNDEPILAVSELMLLPGDRLLISTDPEEIPKSSSLYGQIVVVLDPKKHKRPVLAQVEYVPSSTDDGPEHIEANYFEGDVLAHEIVRRVIHVELDGKKRSVSSPYQVIRGKGIDKIVPVGLVELEPPNALIAHSQIVGICLSMFRRKLHQ